MVGLIPATPMGYFPALKGLITILLTQAMAIARGGPSEEVIAVSSDLNPRIGQNQSTQFQAVNHGYSYTQSLAGALFTTRMRAKASGNFRWT